MSREKDRFQKPDFLAKPNFSNLKNDLGMLYINIAILQIKFLQNSKECLVFL